MSRKKAIGVPAAVSRYLDGLDLEGSALPLAEVALLLANSLEAAPEYARARLAKELRELLGQLADLEERQKLDEEREEWREQRRRQATWARDG